MWLIFVTDDQKMRYMVEVDGTETLSECVEAAKKMHPLPLAVYQIRPCDSSDTPKGRKLPPYNSSDMSKTIQELGLADRKMLIIESAHETQRRTNLPSRSVSLDPGSLAQRLSSPITRANSAEQTNNF